MASFFAEIFAVFGISTLGFTEGQPFPASFACFFINGQGCPVTLTADANRSDLDASLADVPVLPAGTYPAGLYVTEGNNGISNPTYTTINVNVADAQIGSAQGRSLTALVAVPWSGVLASFVDPYLNAQASSYNVAVDYHDGSSPSTAAIVSPDPNVPGGWLVSDMHTFAADGTFTPTITINDTLYGGDAGITAITASATATVSIAPATLAAADLHIQAGDLSGQTLATIADPASSNAWIGSLTLDSGTYPVSINGSAVQVPSLAYLRPGTYPASINLTSTLGGVMRQLSAGFNIVVANAPLATPVLDGIHAAAATAWTGEVATFADGDPIAPASDFFATIDWGDGSVIVSTVGGSGGVFSVVASHTFDALPSHPMFVQVTNIKALPDQPGRIASVSGLAPVPLTLPAVSLVVTQGIAVEMGQASFPTIGLLGGAIAPSADDAGNPLLVLSAQVTINGVTTDASFTPGDGGSLLSVDLPPMNEGVYTAVVHDVYEAGAGQTLVADDATFKVYVNPSNQAEEGFAADGMVALTGVSRSIGPRDAVVITHIDYGDGSSDAFAGAAPCANGVFGLISHNYGEEGTYGVSISGHDYTTGSDVTGNDTMEIADAPLSLTPVAIEATTGKPWDGIVATFVDADPGTDQTPGDYVATMTFPDGSVMPLAITQDSVAEGDNPNQFTISISPLEPKTFGMVGYLSPLLTVTEVQDATAIANGTPVNSTSTTGIAYVADGGSSGTPDVLTANPLPINATTRQPWSGPVATFTDSNPNATGFTAKITWATGQITDGSIAGGNGNWTVSGVHTFFNSGGYPVGVAITGPNNSQAGVTDMAAVTDPSVSASPSSVSNFVGTSQTVEVDVTGNFTSVVPITASGYDSSVQVNETSIALTSDGEQAVFTVTGVSVGDTTISFAVPASNVATVASSVAPATITELDATDAADSTNTVAATDTAAQALYIVESPTGDGSVQVTLGSKTDRTDAKVSYQVTGDGTATAGADNVTYTLTPPAPTDPLQRQVTRYVVTASPTDGAGQAGPARREVDVYVISPVGAKTVADWHHPGDNESIDFPNPIVVGNNQGFLDEYAKKARWSQSKITQTPNDPTNDWTLVSDINDVATYMYSGYIKTYQDELAADNKMGWDYEKMVFDVGAFNSLAADHESAVISQLQQIWDQPVAVSDQTNPASEPRHRRGNTQFRVSELHK